MANQPDIIPMAWAANNSTVSSIPETTSESGKASWDQGFPVETSLPLSQGGVPPKYGDFNGILKVLSQFAVYAQQGGQFAWNSGLDYGVGSIVLGTDGNLYRAAQASSAVNPVGDTSGKWQMVISAEALAGELSAYQEINTKVWTNAVDYSPGAIVFGSDGNLYAALQPSGPATAAVNPVGDASSVWTAAVTADSLNSGTTMVQGWARAGSYANAQPYAQGMCYDTQRGRFVIAQVNADDTAQTLCALDPADFTTIISVGHADLGHANSLTYYAPTDEIISATGLTQDGKRVLIVIDADTLTTKSTLLLSGQMEAHLSYDSALSQFVMARQVSGDKQETFWLYSPEVSGSTLTGLTLASTFTVDLPYAGMFNNGLGCYNGVAWLGGKYVASIDYVNKTILSLQSVSVLCEFEDFVYADGNWYANTNLHNTVLIRNASARLQAVTSMLLRGSIFNNSSATVPTISGQTASSCLRFWGGDTADNGGDFFLAGEKFGSSFAGGFRLSCHKSGNTGNIDGYVDSSGVCHLVVGGVEVATQAGGTFTGPIKRNSSTSSPTVQAETDTSATRIWGGSTANTGATVLLVGDSFNTTSKGQFIVATGTTGQSASGKTSLVGTPGGSLTWGGQPIQTSSDERLKTDFDDVPDDVLDAWGTVRWAQFRYLAAKEAKGEAARLHTGLVAQRVKASFEDIGLDACEYGILCHEEWQDEYDDQGQLILNAGEMWTIRYEEALAMEAAYQRRRADRAVARITALERRLAELEAALASLIAPIGETYAQGEEE